MRRYYLCPIVQKENEMGRLTYTPTLQGLGVNFVADIPFSPVTGRPISSYALTCVATTDHTPVRQVDSIIPLPNTSNPNEQIDISVDLSIKLSAIGINMPSRTSRRDVVQRIGKHFSRHFKYDNFWVSE